MDYIIFLFPVKNIPSLLVIYTAFSIKQMLCYSRSSLFENIIRKRWRRRSGFTSYWLTEFVSCVMWCWFSLKDYFENESDIAHFDSLHTAPLYLGSNIQKFSRHVHSFLQYSWDADWNSHSTAGESHMSTTTVQLSMRIFQKFNLGPPAYSLIQVI